MIRSYFLLTKEPQIIHRSKFFARNFYWHLRQRVRCPQFLFTTTAGIAHRGQICFSLIWTTFCSFSSETDLNLQGVSFSRCSHGLYSGRLIDKTIYSPNQRILLIMTVFISNTAQIKKFLNGRPAKVGDKKAKMLKKMAWLSTNLINIFILSPFLPLNLDICVSEFFIFIWFNVAKITMICPQRRK